MRRLCYSPISPKVGPAKVRRDRSPRSRRTQTHNRPASLKLVFALALVIGASIGQGQPIPDTILLPDSLGPLRPGYHLAFGSSTNDIYVASESSDIIVVDGNTFQRIKRINTGTPVGGALLVSQHNTLYCSYPSQGRIGVIDCETNNIVGSIQVGTRPTLLCYSSGSDKLYCGDTIDGTISVIACSSNTILRVIPVGESLAAMAYDPTSDKVYAATRDAVRAISCSADSTIDSIYEIKGARGLCINKRRKKLYVAGRESPFSDTMYVVSTQVDSVIAEFACGYGLAPGLACNEATDRLYAAVNYDSHISEFDCVGDTLIRYGPLPMYLFSLVCDSVRNRLCIPGGDEGGGRLLVLDCPTFRYTSWTPVGEGPGVLQADPSRYRLMYANSDPEASALTVFDYKSDTVYARGAVPLCGWWWAMSHNPATGELYFPWGAGLEGNGVGVIDEQTNRVVKQVRLPGCNSGLTYSRTSDKFYYQAEYGPFIGRRGLGVVDGSRDSLLGVIEMGDNSGDAFPCWCPEGNKVYCFAEAGPRLYVAAVDCYTDSVVWERDVYDVVRWFEYLDNGLMLCNHTDSLALIDARTDSVLVDSSLAAGAVYASAHTGDGEKVYLVRKDRLEVRSSSSLSLLDTIAWPYFNPIYMAAMLVYSDSTHKLYWFAGPGSEDDSVLAIDATKDTVAARMGSPKLYHRGDAVCLDHTGRYLFCSSPFDSSLRVYDTRVDSLVGIFRHLPYPFAVAASPEQHCIYVGCQDVILVYSDAPPGICEEPATSTSPKRLPQTVVCNVLFLPEAPGLKLQAASLMDISGRKVLNLHLGVNDVRHLAPGVYFVRAEPSAASRQPSAVTKVVVTR